MCYLEGDQSYFLRGKFNGNSFPLKITSNIQTSCCHAHACTHTNTHTQDFKYTWVDPEATITMFAGCWEWGTVSRRSWNTTSNRLLGQEHFSASYFHQYLPILYCNLPELLDLILHTFIFHYFLTHTYFSK